MLSMFHRVRVLKLGRYWTESKKPSLRQRSLHAGAESCRKSSLKLSGISTGWRWIVALDYPHLGSEKKVDPHLSDRSNLTVREANVLIADDSGIFPDFALTNVIHHLPKVEEHPGSLTSRFAHIVTGAVIPLIGVS
jgi:hypothetical protein